VSQAIRIDKEVLILGDTPEARVVSQELLRLGYTVHQAALSEGASDGHAPHTRLHYYMASRLLKLDGHVGDFRAALDCEGAQEIIPASALVVAIGNERFFPAEQYGLPSSARILTVSRVRQQLATPRSAGAALPHRHERLFIALDLGGETSKETAVEALHLAHDLRAQWHSEVHVFYQNLKVDTPWLERLTRELREKGVVFCRYETPKVSVDDEGVSIAYVEGRLQGDWLIMPDAVRPHAATAELAALLRVRVGQDGYFQDVNVRQYRPGLSVRRGIFFAGRCHMDCDAHEAEADALQAVANVDALLGSGVLAPSQEAIAHVDSTKCIRCLTCVRTCAHAAVEIADYGEVKAARVVDLACQGCGACIANCPVQAIEWVGQAAPAWMQGS